MFTKIIRTFFPFWNVEKDAIPLRSFITEQSHSPQRPLISLWPSSSQQKNLMMKSYFGDGAVFSNGGVIFCNWSDSRYLKSVIEMEGGESKTFSLAEMYENVEGPGAEFDWREQTSGKVIIIVDDKKTIFGKAADFEERQRWNDFIFMSFRELGCDEIGIPLNGMEPMSFMSFMNYKPVKPRIPLLMVDWEIPLMKGAGSYLFQFRRTFATSILISDSLLESMTLSDDMRSFMFNSLCVAGGGAMQIALLLHYDNAYPTLEAKLIAEKEDLYGGLCFKKPYGHLAYSKHATDAWLFTLQ